MGFGRKGEGPTHEVTLAHAFCIGQFEVTKRQWRQVEQTAGAPRQPDDDLPITKVSYFDVHHFIDRLNERARKIRYRLPYEAEWEYAIRAQSLTSYSFGDSAADLYRYGNCQSTAEHSDEFEKLAPVGSFSANPWGLFDVHGNVWEWVEDWYSMAYPIGLAIDPTGPPNGEKRVRRGGSFKSSVANCRSTARSGWFPGKGADDLGFRLVQMLEQP
jgi:formylglycine-generating enzyme required for sulfatase activity